jgi:RecB family exonuclease
MRTLDALAALCREHPLREKIVVAPSLAIGHQIGDALARAGTHWINLRFETTRTIADAIAGFAIASQGLTVLSRAQALALIERVCDRVLDETSYFAALADRPGLHRAIQRSIDDLRHAGLDAAAMVPGAFEDPRKATDLARILAAYEEEMQRGRYIDRFGVVAMATQLAKPREGVWVVMEGLELTAAEERLIRAVGAHLNVLGGDDSPQRTQRTQSQIRKALGEENEIRAALRSILAQPETADSAELVYSARDPYLPLTFELLAEHGIPATFAEGIPAHFTRPGQAALAFLRWIGEGWHAVELQRIATPRIARVIRNAGIGWGRERYLPAIEAFVAAKQQALEDEEARPVVDAKEAREFVSEMLKITEGVEAAAAARDFVRTTRVSNEIDVMAREALARMFGELAAVGGGSSTVRLAEAVRNLHVAASNPRPGHLHVAPIRSGGWSGRAQMFVVGLDEERHPGRGAQDPVLLDSERTKIGVPIVGDRAERREREFRALLARGTNITLSWSSLRLRDRREQFPSASVLDVFRADHPNATYEQIIEAAPEDRFVDPTALSASDWWLYRRFAGGEQALRDAVLAAYPSLAAGAFAEAQRDSGAITEYDGLVHAPAEELDPRLNGRPYSASQLERLAMCPYRHFLERVLKVRPLDELRFDPDEWLEARHFGSMLHEVLQRTMEELRDAQAKPSMGFLSRMNEIAAEALHKWRALIPPPSETAFQRRERDLLRSAEVFLRTEETASAEVTPSHFELGFDEFLLPLGGGRTIKLRGFVDRVDRHDDTGEWHIWDYKSGMSRDFEGEWRLRCGTKMQHAIYARAVEAKLGGRVTKSGYSFPTPRGRGARIERECTDADLQRALNLLSDVVASGWFPHAEECSYCEFEAVCGTKKLAAERTRRKLAANPDAPAVQAWQELQGIE